MLAFLLPLIVFYEVTSLTHRQQIVAHVLLRRFMEWFGYVGVWAPGLAIVVILLATHVASKQTWAIGWSHVGWMYVESVIAAIHLLAMHWTGPLQAHSSGSPVLGSLGLAVGAGVYEELVFRLVLVSLILIVGADLLGLNRRRTAIAAVVISSLLFAAHHHPPIGMDAFHPAKFLFRTLAGVYLAVIFWYRGYAPAAGCHAAYNVGLILVG